MWFLYHWTLYLLFTLTSGLAIFNLLFCYKNCKCIKFYWKIHKYYIPVLPFVGNSYIFGLFGVNLNPFALIEWCRKHIGIPLTLWLGNTFIYVTNSTEEAKIILNHPKCYNKAEFYGSFMPFFGDTLLFAPYEIWKPHRRHLLKAFKPTHLKLHAKVYYEQSCELVENLKYIKEDEDLFDYFTKYSTTNFFLSHLGYNGNERVSDIESVRRILQEGLIQFKSVILNPILPVNLWIKWFPSGRKFRKLMKDGLNFVKNLIEDDWKRKALLEKNEEVNLISVILTMDNKVLREEDVLNEVIVFFTAASDTTAYTMAFCFTLLGMHSDIQEKVYREVTELVGEGEITYSDLPNLKYTEAVINETLRILPVIPAIGRTCGEDIDLGTKVIPKGTSCLISIYWIHRDPKIWPEPLKFDPARNLPENQSKIKSCSFLPFSVGSRDCIAKTFSMVLMKITVANMVRNFTITSKHKSIDEFALESLISLRTTNLLDCQFRPRPKS